MDRNEWLKNAVRLLRILFRSHGRKLPRRILVSVGFPSGSVNGRVAAECWASETSSGATQIFISPSMRDPIEILEVLTHELIHAHLDNEGGHGHQFQAVAKQFGLVSPWVEAHAGIRLRPQLLKIAEKLGKYRNPVFTGGDPEYNEKSKARLLKVFCRDCDYIIRATRFQINRGIPNCPVCSKQMEENV